jgi:hypothetical protein
MSGPGRSAVHRPTRDRLPVWLDGRPSLFPGGEVGLDPRVFVAAFALWREHLMSASGSSTAGLIPRLTTA